ncbi:porphobilinogen synthase [Egicoccus sp. AB-alg6-2]|uniref:porphobilinogen synthase n=1 Tax=Egicoccus sp. AB-alg6-2 TaxID=3242692 RepID=UPI00359D3B34
MPFPETRLRRLRRTAALRRAFAETRIDPAGLVLPVFVKDGIEGAHPIGSMPGVAQHDVASAVDLARRAADVGVGGVILFGIPEVKDQLGSSGWDPEGPVPRAARAMRDALGDELVLWADVCQCEYTDHGHCGPLDARGQVVNDAAVEAYVRDALTYADAGVDVVAPSGMMDGQVGAIRQALDGKGFEDVVLVAYAAKYASAFYGPFREAAESTMQDGDRAGHQMDPANRREALRELASDVEEGADVLMVKPALAYLDVIADARSTFDLPVAAYQVSGEYAMVQAAAERGWLDGPRAMRETVTSIRRAGADLVLTYAAIELAAGA